MTKDEFYTYVNTLADSYGNFNYDTIYEIGKKFKELPTRDKNWDDLASILNYSGSGESLRSYIKRRQNRDKILPIKDIDNIVSKNDSYTETFKESIQLRDIYNAYRSELRNEARVDRFKNDLFESVRNMQKLNIPNIQPYKISESTQIEAILLLSDLHLGVNCDNFYNRYNYEIAQQRIGKLAEDVLSYCKQMNVSKLNVINLGDLIHGLIHVDARLRQEFDIIDQLTKAAELVSWLLATLAKSGVKITYRSCTDNHSRTMANKTENIENENLNRIIDWYLKARLQSTPIQFVDDNIDASIGKFTLDNGKKVMFAHGHLENIDKVIDNFFGATREFIDYVLLSHYHAGREKSYNGSKLIINGSIVGTEDYALSKRLFSPAEQKLLIFDKDNFIDISINLQ